MRQLRRSLYLNRGLCVLLTLALAACGSIGPKTLDQDQLDYGRSAGGEQAPVLTIPTN